MSYAYDAANQLTSVTDWGSNSISYAYDGAGRLTSKTLPTGTGVVSSYAYDTANRLTGITHVKDGSTTIASVNYTLDAVGNRTQRIDQQGTHSYAYDNLYRLTSVTYPGPNTTSYAFDAFGNRTSKTNASGTTGYSYDDADRITSVTPPSPAPVVSYTWDNNGNLTNRGSDSFSWDYEDRMTSATVNSVASTFAYRGDGLRDSRTTGGNTTAFTWDIAGGLPVVLDDGSQYVYGAGLTAMKQSGSWFYYLADGLGSTMAIVDSAGAVQKGYTYDVYGKPTATGSLNNEFDFAGQQTDATGLQYLRARYMDPETGAFLSREPMAILPGWSGNHFGYADARPVSLVDPSGLAASPPDWKCGFVDDDSDPTPGCPNTGIPAECGTAFTGPCANSFPGIPDVVGDIVAATLVEAVMGLGEYPHRWLKDCALDPDCRNSVDNGFDARPVDSAALKALLGGAKQAFALVQGANAIWNSYKRAYDPSQESWSRLRGKVEHAEDVFWWGKNR